MQQGGHDHLAVPCSPRRPPGRTAPNCPTPSRPFTLRLLLVLIYSFVATLSRGALAANPSALGDVGVGGSNGDIQASGTRSDTLRNRDPSATVIPGELDLKDPTLQPDLANGRSSAAPAGMPHRRHLASSPKPGLRVVVVNDIAGHFEVLAGVLASLHRIHRLSQHHQQPANPQSQAQLQLLSQLEDIRLAPKPRVVYTGNPSGPSRNGLHDWLGAEVTALAAWHPFEGHAADGGGGAEGGGVAHAAGWQAPADIVVCVSAELAPKVCSSVLGAVRPRLAVVVVHRADTHTPTAKWLSLHPHPAAPLRLFALAPHVANLSSHRLRREVDWAMPVAPFAPPGGGCASKACLQGFSIQGALRRYKSKRGNGFTRDFPALWARMLELRAAGRRVPHVVVVGKGERRQLGLPAELEDSVAFHPWLRYPDFWSLIARSYALVPAFGMPVYYESRISSTVIASLVTCVPLIAEQRLLDTYTFLGERHVFLRQPGEDEVAAMARVMQLPEQEIFTTRRALCELRAAMNDRADALLATYMRQAAEAGAGAGAGAAVGG